MKRILHPTDFSECAKRAEEEAIKLLRPLGAELLLLHVCVEAPLFNEGLFGLVEPQKVYEAQRRWAEGMLKERVAAIREAGVTVRSLVRSGVPHAEIIKVAADEGCDLIVMGTRGFWGLNRVLLGSVADRVIRLAPCPVMTVHAAPEPAGEDRR
jgi:nucleotide-binding universal stress UspA family protein